jgi:SAM-dependent methyltransferase
MRDNHRMSSYDKSHFETLHSASVDPWNTFTSEYEREKRARLLDMLPHKSWQHAVELGCSVGRLTNDLSAIAQKVLAIDGSEIAIDIARTNLRDCGNVELRLAVLPTDLPDKSFDLIVISEILYFVSRADIVTTAHWTASQVSEGAICALVNYLGDTQTEIMGMEAADIFIAAAFSSDCKHQRYDSEIYRIDIITQNDTAK